MTKRELVQILNQWPDEAHIVLVVVNDIHTGAPVLEGDKIKVEVVIIQE